MKALTILAIVLLFALPASAAALPFDSSWWTVDAGGTYQTAGAYTLGATAGQPDAATVAGGLYELRGGYWPGGTVRHIDTYLPLMLGYLDIRHTVTYGQITIVALGLVLCSVWRWRRA